MARVDSGFTQNLQITRQRQTSAKCRHSAINSLASERLFGTLSNTLNCIRPWNFGQDLCRATAKIRLISFDRSPSIMESVRCALSNRMTCRYGVSQRCSPISSMMASAMEGSAIPRLVVSARDFDSVSAAAGLCASSTRSACVASDV